MEQIPFVPSAPNTLGIELELQLIDPRTFDLTAASDELLAQMADHPIADRVKPEITRSMIELNSSVHEHPMGLLAEMRILSCAGRNARYPTRRASSTWRKCTATSRASSPYSASISTWASKAATRRSR
jgi:hypothetical protein